MSSFDNDFAYISVSVRQRSCFEFQGFRRVSVTEFNRARALRVFAGAVTRNRYGIFAAPVARAYSYFNIVEKFDFIFSSEFYRVRSDSFLGFAFRPGLFGRSVHAVVNKERKVGVVIRRYFIFSSVDPRVFTVEIGKQVGFGFLVYVSVLFSRQNEFNVVGKNLSCRRRVRLNFLHDESADITVRVGKFCRVENKSRYRIAEARLHASRRGCEFGISERIAVRFDIVVFIPVAYAELYFDFGKILGFIFVRKFNGYRFARNAFRPGEFRRTVAAENRQIGVVVHGATRNLVAADF